MNEFSPWTQGNWYALGSLLTQLAFLAAGIWFARNIVKTMRAFQEQIGALLKLSITASPVERHASVDGAKHAADASPYWLTPSEVQTASLPEPIKSGPSRLVVTWHRLVTWMREPMSPAELIPWRRASR
jgi:hypothetical protein